MKKLADILGIDHLEIDLYDEQYEELIDLYSVEAKKRNAETVKCPHCGEEGNRPNMMRWHMDNCTTILKKCHQCGTDMPKKGTVNHRYQKQKYCSRKCWADSKKGTPPIQMTDEVREKLSIAAKKDAVNRSMRMKKNKVWDYSPRHVYAKNKPD